MTVLSIATKKDEVFQKVSSKLGFPLRFTWPQWMNAFLPEVFISTTWHFRFIETYGHVLFWSDYFALWTRFSEELLSDYQKYCINCYIQLSILITSQTMSYGASNTACFLSSIFIWYYVIYIIWNYRYKTRSYLNLWSHILL